MPRLERSKNRKGLIVILVLVATIFLCYSWYSNSRYQYFLTTPADTLDNTKIAFTIKKGDAVNKVTTTLKEKNLILDESAFKQFLKSKDYDRKIVAGRFMLNRTMTIPEIAETIVDSGKSQFIVTVQEGLRVTDIDKKLVELELIKPGEFISAVKNFKDYSKYPFLDEEKMKDLIYPLEGYLFPDTYFVDPQNFYSENLIQMMLTNFKNKLGDNLSESDGKPLNEIIIMASIIEKEVRTAADLPIVSGILWKRLDNSWLLGADATLLYLKDNNTIDYNDLQKDTPYNTRKNQGLPPGPINNPGLDAIMAALHPKDSPYFYYLTKPDSGEVVYSKTNEEHNANKQKYLY